MKSKPVKQRNRVEHYAETMRIAATKLGISIDVLRACKAAGCPAFRVDGRVHLQEFDEWYDLHKTELPDVSRLGAEIQWRAADRQAQAEMRQHKLALARREVVTVKEIRITQTRLICETKKRFMEGMRTLVQEVALHCNADEKQIAWALAQGEKRTRDVLTELSKSEWAGLDCPHCAKRIEA